MATISRNALVMFSCEQMYNLVNDIEKYPDFIPGCADAKCISESETKMEGALLISKVGVSKWFSTTNELIPNQQIKLHLRDGPFKQLSGSWIFTALDETACKVELNLEFEFSSKLIEMAFGKIFNQVISSMVTAFTQRAKQVYG